LKLEAQRRGSPSGLNGRHYSSKAFSQSSLAVGRSPLAIFNVCPWLWHGQQEVFEIRGPKVGRPRNRTTTALTLDATGLVCDVRTRPKPVLPVKPNSVRRRTVVHR
jgi:hypothetical protein